jgi:hypothetical protein
MKSSRHYVFAAMLAGLAAGVMGCAEQRLDEDWDEQSRRVKEEESQYIEIQKSLGVSEADAKGARALDTYWTATEGRNKKIIMDKQDIEQGKVSREIYY